MNLFTAIKLAQCYFQILLILDHCLQHCYYFNFNSHFIYQMYRKNHMQQFNLMNYFAFTSQYCNQNFMVINLFLFESCLSILLHRHLNTKNSYFNCNFYYQKDVYFNIFIFFSLYLRFVFSLYIIASLNYSTSHYFFQC